MTRLGTIARLLVCALVFLVIVGPHLLSLRVGRGRIAARMPVIFHRVFLRLFGLRVTQSGSPPGECEPALVLSNHVSWLDIIVLGSLRPLSFVAKSEIAGWPVGSLSVMVMVWVFVVPTLPTLGVPRVRITVSSDSFTRSLMMLKVKLPVLAPLAMVTEPAPST